jgi:hypothetical protein
MIKILPGLEAYQQTYIALCELLNSCRQASDKMAVTAPLQLQWVAVLAHL